MPFIKPSYSQSRITAQNKPAQIHKNESCGNSKLSGLTINEKEAIKLSGLVPRHCIALKEFAAQSNCVIAFRPVEPISTQLIAENYPTKNFHIKGKSSTWGPMAGFIAVKQSLSKLENSPTRIEPSNEKVQECMKDGYAVSGPLEISTERLTYLITEGVLEKQGDTLYAKGPSGAKYEFSACANKDNGKLTITQHGEPVMVLCDPESKMPLTADYDLMLIATPLEQYGPKDIPENIDIHHGHFLERVSGYKTPLPAQLQAQKDSPALFYSKENKELGNVTGRVQELIPQLNEAMGCQPGREVVHHSMDANNPVSDPSSNYPVTLFLPRKFGEIAETMVVARNKEELKEIITLTKDEGFYVPLNPLWEPEVNSILRPSFVRARAVFS
ncbi:anthrax toxin-like adenylyl cyclase domain-containing protein, partial [Iodobacter sp. LRB]|uniref:anthrax toxin-like adenylyl cyclase domain-containing protein n=1 Tax=unclassified Iodobacter TaxID=235634 RepID=UPI000C1178B3|nr:anthrax toxin-like adenylyl cyclase domain-containing protein [Iodobacter sp. BJB302]PHU99485.1 adenylate cyclase [Iodobacter sp. BJB302]